MSRISYKRDRFPPAVMQHVVWLCSRFTLSLRDVKKMLAHRGVDVSYGYCQVSATIQHLPKKWGHALDEIA